MNVAITTKLVESIDSVDEKVKSKLICYVEMPMNLAITIETKSTCNNGKKTHKNRKQKSNFFGNSLFNQKKERNIYERGLALITRLCVFVWVGSSRFNLQQRKNNI
jgi:hypothetical protein